MITRELPKLSTAQGSQSSGQLDPLTARARASAALKLGSFLEGWRAGNIDTLMAHSSLNWQRFNASQGFDARESLNRATEGRTLLAYRFDSGDGVQSSPGLSNAWEFPVTLAFRQRGLKVFESPVIQVVCCSRQGGFSSNPNRSGIWGVSVPSLKSRRPSRPGQPPGAGRHLRALPNSKAKGLV